VKRGRNGSTWYHPLLALHFAAWLHPRFGVMMDVWCARFISGDATLIRDVARRVDEVHGTKSLVTHTMVDRKEHDAKLAEAHEAAARWQSQVFQLQQEVKEIASKQAQAFLQIQDARQQATDARVKYEQSQLYWDDYGSQLESKIRTLGAELDEDVQVLQLSRKRKLREIQHTLHVAEDMEAKMLQEGDAESMPTRYIALRGVTEGSSGRTNKGIRELNKAVFYAMGQNVARYSRHYEINRDQLYTILEEILDDEVEESGVKSIRSNISIFTMICGHIKRSHGLRYSTHLSLRKMYKYCRDYNAWVVDRDLPEKYRLIQQDDLASLLGYQGYQMPRLPRYESCDIRNFFSHIE